MAHTHPSRKKRCLLFATGCESSRIIWFGHDFPRMAALTAGNLKDTESYDALKKLYLDEHRYEMVRAEAFRAMGKIDPERTAIYVIKELSSKERMVFVIYATMILKEAYGTSFKQMQESVDNIE